MKEAYGYGQVKTPYYTEIEERQIAETATREGVFHGAPLKMSELLENFVRMTIQDASDMTMFHSGAEQDQNDCSPMIADATADAEALLMANRAVEIVENGGELSAQDYIGSGSDVHSRAVDYLPLVFSQRQAS